MLCCTSQIMGSSGLEMLQIMTGDGRHELRRFYMELYPTLALHLRVLPLDPHLICVAKG